MEREWLQVEIDRELKHRFKVRAIQKRKNMTNVLQSLLELYNAGELDELLAEKENAVTDKVAV